MLPGHRQANNNLAKWASSSAQSIQPYAPWTKKTSVESTVDQGSVQILQRLRLTQLHSLGPCSTVLSSGLQCTCSEHKHQLHIRGHSCARHRQHWPWMGGGQEPAEVLTNYSMQNSNCTPSMYQNTGIWGSSHTGVGTWLSPAIPARWLPPWDHIPLLPKDREKRLFLHSHWPLWQK